MQEALPSGAIDVNIEGWQHNIIGWYEEELEKGTILNLGVIYEASSQVFVIPRWVAETYEIETVFDMKHHWELFTDPEDPSKPSFHDSPPQRIRSPTVRSRCCALWRRAMATS